MLIAISMMTAAGKGIAFGAKSPIGLPGTLEAAFISISRSGIG